MAHKKAGGSSRNGRDSAGRRLGLKMYGGESVLANALLISKVQRHSDGLEVLLAEGATAQSLLKELITADAIIERFEMIEPSLHDIFIEKVTGNA